MNQLRVVANGLVHVVPGAVVIGEGFYTRYFSSYPYASILCRVYHVIQIPHIHLVCCKWAVCIRPCELNAMGLCRSQIPELARGRPELATMGISASLLFLVSCHTLH